jgi:hypothetical protein
MGIMMFMLWRVVEAVVVNVVNKDMVDSPIGQWSNGSRQQQITISNPEGGHLRS